MYIHSESGRALQGFFKVLFYRKDTESQIALYGKHFNALATSSTRSVMFDSDVGCENVSADTEQRDGGQPDERMYLVPFLFRCCSILCLVKKAPC